MKRMISIALMVTITISGMKEENQSWSIASFLNEHDWHERKDNLTNEQRKKFAECVDYRKKEFKDHITERDLALILIDSLDEAEECKIPKKFTTSAQGNQWLYRAIMNDSPQEIKKVFKGLQELYYSSNYPQDIFIDDLFNNQQRGCKLPYINQKPLICAISLARPRAVRALLELKADPNVSSKDFPRPVDYALQLGDPKSALELVRAGANFKERTNNPGYPTAIGHVIGLFNQDPETCSQLIQEMFDRGYSEQLFDPQTNERNTNVWALALTASQYGLSADEEISKSLVDLFIKNGCDINKPVFCDQIHITPLAIALDVRNMHNIELLLEAKADPNKQFTYGGRFIMVHRIRNTNGFITPLEYAQQMALNNYPNAQEIIELFSKYINQQSQEKIENNQKN